MPAIKQTKQQTDGATVPPVTHRAVLGVLGSDKRNRGRVTIFVDGVKQPPRFEKTKETPRHG